MPPEKYQLKLNRLIDVTAIADFLKFMQGPTKWVDDIIGRLYCQDLNISKSESGHLSYTTLTIVIQ